jgi:hypothetical protein
MFQNGEATKMGSGMGSAMDDMMDMEPDDVKARNKLAHADPKSSALSSKKKQKQTNDLVRNYLDTLDPVPMHDGDIERQQQNGHGPPR